MQIFNITFLYRIIIIISSYIFGSFPTAYIIYKMRKGGDIRKYGSGNVGGTNVTRTVGVSFGIITIIADIVKGFIPITVVYFLFPQDLVLLSIVSVAVILGHDFSAFIKFKGGKGIATSCGVIIGVCSYPFLDNKVWIRTLPIIIILFTALVVFLIFRIVSLSSIGAAIATPLAFYFIRYPVIIVISAAIWSILAFITHRDNIKRLIKGKEKKIRGKGKGG